MLETYALSHWKLGEKILQCAVHSPPFLFNTAETMRFNLAWKSGESRFQLISEAKMIINTKQNQQILIFLKLEKKQMSFWDAF